MDIKNHRPARIREEGRQREKRDGTPDGEREKKETQNGRTKQNVLFIPFGHSGGEYR